MLEYNQVVVCRQFREGNFLQTSCGGLDVAKIVKIRVELVQIVLYVPEFPFSVFICVLCSRLVYVHELYWLIKKFLLNFNVVCIYHEHPIAINKVIFLHGFIPIHYLLCGTIFSIDKITEYYYCPFFHCQSFFHPSAIYHLTSVWLGCTNAEQKMRGPKPTHLSP